MICMDCKIDTRSIGEYFMINKDLWTFGKGFLCIGCLENRLGRKLEPKDFLLCPLNLSLLEFWDFASQRLLDRLGRFSTKFLREKGIVGDKLGEVLSIIQFSKSRKEFADSLYEALK